jgi:hypothetical protein
MTTLTMHLVSKEIGPGGKRATPKKRERPGREG